MGPKATNATLGIARPMTGDECDMRCAWYALRRQHLRTFEVLIAADPGNGVGCDQRFHVEHVRSPPRVGIAGEAARSGGTSFPATAARGFMQT